MRCISLRDFLLSRAEEVVKEAEIALKPYQEAVFDPLRSLTYSEVKYLLCSIAYTISNLRSILHECERHPRWRKLTGRSNFLTLRATLIQMDLRTLASSFLVLEGDSDGHPVP